MKIVFVFIKVAVNDLVSKLLFCIRLFFSPQNVKVGTVFLLSPIMHSFWIGESNLEEMPFIKLLFFLFEKFTIY